MDKQKRIEQLARRICREQTGLDPDILQWNVTPLQVQTPLGPAYSYPNTDPQPLWYRWADVARVAIEELIDD